MVSQSVASSLSVLGSLAFGLLVGAHAPALAGLGPPLPAGADGPRGGLAVLAGARHQAARRVPRVRRRVGGSTGTSSPIAAALPAGGVGSGSGPVTLVAVSPGDSGSCGWPGSVPAR